MIWAYFGLVMAYRNNLTLCTLHKHGILRCNGEYILSDIPSFYLLHEFPTNKQNHRRQAVPHLLHKFILQDTVIYLHKLLERAQQERVATTRAPRLQRHQRHTVILKDSAVYHNHFWQWHAAHPVNDDEPRPLASKQVSSCKGQLIRPSH
jgi:hypothetical protein